MVRSSSLVLAICLSIGGIAPAAADDDPAGLRSLRMRPRSHAAPRPQASHPPRRPGAARGKQLAQSPPADSPAHADPVADAPLAALGTEPAPIASPHPGHPAPPLPPEAPAAAAPPELSESDFARLAEQDFKEEVIVVTGSTIGRKTLTTSAPLTIIDREMLATAGQPTLGDILQQLPAQQNGMNAQVNTGDDGGATRIDLRGITSARTLTLINGRRVVPSGIGANASVDLNTIPLAIIERVEILKDGASAIYGSDAVGGVVNIITRTDFDRSEAALYSGGTQHGDGFAYEASFVTGHAADAKKGNILFAAGVHRQEPVFAGDRAFSRNDLTYDYASRTVIPGGSTVVPGGRINTQAIDIDGDGRPDSVDLCGAGVQYCTHSASGGYRPFVAPADLYNAQPSSYLYTPSSRYYLFTTGSYQLGSHTSTFFEGSYANRRSAQQIAADQFFNSVPISRDSMYNPLGGTVLGYERRLDEFGPRRAEQNIGTFRIVGGLKGSMPEDFGPLKRFKWELSYNYGRNEGAQVSTGNLIRSRLAAAVGPSFMNTAGVPTCGTPTRPIPGCVPMNVLGATGSIDPASIEYVTFTGVRNGFNQQQTLLAETHGQIAKLPNNGDLSIAVGGDFRAESGATTPDPLAATGDTTGTSVAPTKGSYSVAEGFAELSLVPVSGKPLAQWVELNLAARAFRYNTFGSGVTWKGGALYRPVNGFAVRGTYSTAFRAPSITELFEGRNESFFPVIDPCDTRPFGTPITLDPGVAAECANRGVPANAAFGAGFSRVQTSGNPTVEPETARLLTAGFVVEPPQLKGLAVTFDYFRAAIEKTIGPALANGILANCYIAHDEASCQRVHRNELFGGAIDYIETPTTNSGSADGSGIDFAVTFDRKLGAAGRFRQQLESQYLLAAKIDTSFQVLQAVDNNDFGARPRLRASLSSLWQHPGGMGAGFNLRYVGSFDECEQNSCNSGLPSRRVDAWHKVDLFGSYSLSSRAGTTSVTLGVNNLLDRDPPSIYGSVYGDYDPTAYDFKGRFFYARLSQQF
jgi:iron complex outermembrane recepter protein